MRILFTVFLSVFLLQNAVAERTGKGTVKREKITVAGSEREYVSYVPKNLGMKRPLLISCHGMNQDANYQKGMMDLQPIADTAKFVTVFPEGEGKSWDISGEKDVKFVLKIISAMVKRYDIDPRRVYLSGFSMGGMFTYHCMNMIPNRIAAFAPISGYPMGGATANASVRAIPIIHTHGTGDDVVTFSNVQNNLNVWINHNHCNKTAKVTKRYRNAPHITRHEWDGGDDGTKVVLMEMADKGHWISNDYGVYTADEIWKFCKNYSIVKPVLEPDERFTKLQGSTPFAIVNEAEHKAFYGVGTDALAYDAFDNAFDDIANEGYLFRVGRVGKGRGLRLINTDGEIYMLGDDYGYLNSQAVTGDCCFLNGLSSQNGYDIPDGAIWDMQYVDNKGWTLKNKGTGKYLKDAAHPAMFDEPTYFTFCTLKETSEPTGITNVRSKKGEVRSGVYTLDGRRVNAENLRPGLYIVNGKKIVIK